ncbi:MAG: T9SS type A sorting domain-containing protein, partial [Flavobacteriaceae bacterium]|nr:T9SS type A sorting domain-containing protein [Flavobacteriaceae bacterium]
LILVVGVVVVTFNQKSVERPTLSSQDELNKQYPGEWFYNERAYPNNFINRQAIKEAEVQAKSILQNRNNTGGDWVFNGPFNTGGRITDVAISPDSDDVFFAAAASGGIFRTTDRGVTWDAVFDDQSKLSIGDIAIAPSNSQVIYAGTGEANGSVNTGAFFGDGVYRSTNGGDSWTNIGLENSDHIGRIVVDPNDPNRVFVAATGKLYDYNPERGVYRTTNGGTDWEQVLFVTDSTAAIDVAMNPQNTNIIYAAMWERTRKPWQRDYGGVTSAIHRSLDGGDTWEELGVSNGLPAPSAQRGRIGIAISESDPATVYARFTTNEITNTFDGLYKSTNNGNNWTLVTQGALSFIDASFGWYFGNLRVNPQDPENVYVLGQTLYRTSNSGTSWSEVSGMHVDHHAMEFSQNNNDFILAGNDGGLYLSENGGNSWNKFTNLPLTQFYNIEVDYSQPERLYGGTQDNNTIRTITGGLNDWSSIWGGDGFHVNVDPEDNSFVYAEAQFGALGRSIDGGNSFQGATDGIDFNDRNNWNTPVVLSPFHPATAYYGTNRLYSSERAVFWTVMSPDLTDGPHPSGSLSYGTLTAIAPSYLNLNTVYTGSDDGNVQVTFDAGITWENISAGLPDRYVTSIAISPTDDLTAYVALSGYGVVDYDPHIFKTTDGGQNWTPVSGNLPDIPVNDIIINSTEDLLFAATDLNVWYSQNDGATWTILGNNLPLTLTRDIKLHEPTNTLYAGTYGRSMYSYDLGQIVLGTEDFAQNANSIVISPNPVSERLNIHHELFGKGKIELIDITGKVIQNLYEGNLENSSDYSKEVGNISEGIYFLKFSGAMKSITKRIIKE